MTRWCRKRAAQGDEVLRREGGGYGLTWVFGFEGMVEGGREMRKAKSKGRRKLANLRDRRAELALVFSLR